MVNRGQESVKYGSYANGKPPSCRFCSQSAANPINLSKATVMRTFPAAAEARSHTSSRSRYFATDRDICNHDVWAPVRCTSVLQDPCKLARTLVHLLEEGCYI
uniref:Uncharacterized protein n=1 Tax=Physcomitrium patens TaxID=3218 RepID=A9TMM1_PHYPA|nr:hypothetical protein PHYPA_026661 [Physcomitrium patens]